MKISMVGIVLTIVLSLSASAQESMEYNDLKAYRKWSIVAGPVLFDKATISPQYGDYTFKNKRPLGFNAGFEYDFYPSKKWSFMTGLIVSLEPVYNIRFTIKKEDTYFNMEVSDKAKMYSITSFSAPFLVRMNIQASRKLFLNFSTGLKATYFPKGEAEFSLTLSNEDDTESRQVFGLRLKSPENAFQGSFVIGTGCSYALDKVLLKANLVYVMNFQNTISGEYQFGNLFSSPPTRGYYNLSGNYLGLLFSASLKKGWGKR